MRLARRSAAWPIRLLLIVAMTVLAAGYTNTEQRRFITKLKSKIDEGLA